MDRIGNFIPTQYASRAGGKRSNTRAAVSKSLFLLWFCAILRLSGLSDLLVGPNRLAPLNLR